MALHIYNTLTRKKEIFTPINPGSLKMYVCGMTVYSDAHIGHARTYVAFDMIRRYFEYKGLNVTYVQNITDVDDKIIAAAHKENIDSLAYSQRFTDRCLADLDALGIRRADLYPKASETIPDMIAMIGQIIARGYGYVADGDVYFSVEKFANYGKLSGQNIQEMKAGARIEPGELKRSPLDFALWKKGKPGEPTWPSPWSPGRPGWHIECSAMSSKFLGLPFDIHGGGMDLRFPHHENEVAQAEAATGKQFARCWMHIGLLTINGEKMSKSLGNIINIRDLLRSWDPEVLRMFFVQAHYRSPPDFSEKALTDVAKGLERLYRVKEQLEKHGKKETKHDPQLTEAEKLYHDAVLDFQHEFESAMDDDFNTPKAFASFFEFVNTSNKFFEQVAQPNPEVCSTALNMYLKLGNVLTLFQPKKIDVHLGEGIEVNEKLALLLQKTKATAKSQKIEDIMHALLTAREDARRHKDWKTADLIRKDLEALGFEIQDTAQGPVWRKK